VNCPKCGKELHPDERIVCTQCGTPVLRTYTEMPAPRPQRQPLLGGPAWTILGAVFAILVIAPAGVGFRARESFNATVGQIAALGLRPRVVVYRQGWFGSHATLNLGVRGMEIVLDERIEHGPYPFWAGWFSVIPVAAIIDSRAADNQGPAAPPLPSDLVVRTAIYLNGRSRMRVTMPPRTVTRGISQAHFLGLDGEIAPLGDQLRVSLRSPGIVGRGLVGWSISDLAFSGDWRRLSSGIWTGGSESTIREANLALPNGRGINLELISADSSSKLAQGMMRYDGSLRISSAVLGVERIGSFTLAWELKKVDPAAIEAWNRRAQALAAMKLDKQALMAEAQSGLADFTRALAAKGPQLDAKFQTSTSDGDVTASLNLSITPEQAATPASQPEAGALMAAILKERLFGKATVHAPTALVDRVAGADKVNQLVQNGALVKDGSQYVIQADFAGGKLTMNGKEVLDVAKLPPAKPRGGAPAARPPRAT
jgi:uncharacterized protein YdgA (DUF945 family)